MNVEGGRRPGGAPMDNSDASSPSWNVDGLSIVQRIILAAIMSVCGTGIVLLCSYMCCTAVFAYQRRRRHSDVARFVGMGDMLQQQQHRDMEAQRAQYGIDPDVLEAMPVFVFGEEGRGDGGRLECAVCLGEFRVGEKGRVLPLCRHSFHKECIDMWLYSHSTCPLCRGNMNSKS